MKLTKKRRIVDTVVYTGDNIEELNSFIDNSNIIISEDEITVTTPICKRVLNIGDYVVRLGNDYYVLTERQFNYQFIDSKGIKKFYIVK